ncbi:hypothetical protein DYI42_23750, partial [Vannielia litorea]|nr:hypothetical protein [Vannielia litorea]
MWRLAASRQLRDGAKPKAASWGGHAVEQAAEDLALNGLQLLFRGLDHAEAPALFGFQVVVVVIDRGFAVLLVAVVDVGEILQPLGRQHQPVGERGKRGELGQVQPG